MTFLQIESLTPDVDFRSHITREEFETLCDDLMQRATVPLKTLLDRSNLRPVLSLFCPSGNFVATGEYFICGDSWRRS